MTRNKFGAKKIEIGGEVYDSTGEANRHAQLKLLERAKAIKALSRQPRYVLCVNGHEVCEYIGDFAYYDGGRLVVEDFKGVITPEFRLKRKLFLALHPEIELRVTNRKGAVVNIRTRSAPKRRAAA